MKTKISILESIKLSIERQVWSRPKIKARATELCIAIFNLYVMEGGDFYMYKSISFKYFRKVIRTKGYVEEIMNNLIEGGIIQRRQSYNVAKKIAKGYRFHPDILNGSNTYHICCPDFPVELWNDVPLGIWMEKLAFDPLVYNWINDYIVDSDEILIDREIPDTHMNISFDVGDDYRYEKEKAILLAHSNGNNLIKWKNKFYIETPNNFILRKQDELKKIFNGYVFNIDNGCVRISRNDTNNRLDYNLTNMKKELIDFIRYEGEELVELDIANCQFAILAKIAKGLDPLFIKLAQEGGLYKHISDVLDISSIEAKSLMFNVAFDKIRAEQDIVRDLFPMTMDWIDTYKKKNGYKSFSNLLQKTESEIMIDGLFKHLYKLGYIVFPIHDAVRVKGSEGEIIKSATKKYFNKIGFCCKIRKK
ncbi:hypothetical protein UFOVP182_33 [uncultured Caudovirales phage]|uniref:Uncharacterized protein n=1 Tax=uncultured Caudovirales phage TaxID=2100421 RepID=A0A6J7WKF6_9CAUD|nr:hypothetical protein UFOVP182_33 [uncultured Caudovirales phage]